MRVCVLAHLFLVVKQTAPAAARRGSCCRRRCWNCSWCRRWGFGFIEEPTAAAAAIPTRRFPRCRRWRREGLVVSTGCELLSRGLSPALLLNSGAARGGVLIDTAAERPRPIPPRALLLRGCSRSRAARLGGEGNGVSEVWR